MQAEAYECTQCGGECRELNSLNYCRACLALQAAWKSTAADVALELLDAATAAALVHASPGDVLDTVAGVVARGDATVSTSVRELGRDEREHRDAVRELIEAA